jgi:hypothetical protein
MQLWRLCLPKASGRATFEASPDRIWERGLMTRLLGFRRFVSQSATEDRQDEGTSGTVVSQSEIKSLDLPIAMRSVTIIRVLRVDFTEA